MRQRRGLGQRVAQGGAGRQADLVGMGFTYRTARAVMMVGSVSDPRGLRPQLIGPAHATISNVATGGRKALCGAYVARDEQVPWPPQEDVVDLLCSMCSELALL